jgi:ABC transporter with metal-binding/Fe-S-binding domain ATP-binding protein
MRLLALYTGGKDSTLSLHMAREAGHEIALLVTARSLERDSWMFHTTCIGVQHLQAKAMGLEHRYVDVSGRKEAEVQELCEALRGLVKEYGVEGLLSGGLASRYQRDRIEWLAGRLGLKHVAPCWGMGPREVMSEVLARGYYVMIVAVSAHGLGPEWLGRRLDRESVELLATLSERHGFNLAGEGGEYETLVLDAPFFSDSLRIEAEPVWLGDRGYLRLIKASLTPKIS